MSVVAHTVRSRYSQGRLSGILLYHWRALFQKKMVWMVKLIGERQSSAC